MTTRYSTAQTAIGIIPPRKDLLCETLAYISPRTKLLLLILRLCDGDWEPCKLNVSFPPSHEEACLGKVQGVVGILRPGCTLQILTSVLSCSVPSKWPCQPAVFRDWFLQNCGIKGFLKQFSWPMSPVQFGSQVYPTEEGRLWVLLFECYVCWLDRKGVV